MKISCELLLKRILSQQEHLKRKRFREHMSCLFFHALCNSPRLPFINRFRYGVCTCLSLFLILFSINNLRGYVGGFEIYAASLLLCQQCYTRGSGARSRKASDVRCYSVEVCSIRLKMMIICLSGRPFPKTKRLRSNYLILYAAERLRLYYVSYPWMGVVMFFRICCHNRLYT